MQRLVAYPASVEIHAHDAREGVIQFASRRGHGAAFLQRLAGLRFDVGHQKLSVPISFFAWAYPNSAPALNAAWRKDAASCPVIALRWPSLNPPNPTPAATARDKITTKKVFTVLSSSSSLDPRRCF